MYDDRVQKMITRITIMYEYACLSAGAHMRDYALCMNMCDDRGCENIQDFDEANLAVYLIHFIKLRGKRA